MTDLEFEGLADLPQVATLRQVASTLWQRQEVIAIWLGGSFVRREADGYSDLDLRVAVVGEVLYAWAEPDLSALSTLVGVTVVGGNTRGWEGTVLHHLVLVGGVIVDLLIQSTDREPPEDATLVLGCRDPAFGHRLARAHLPPTEEVGPADPAAVRQTLVDFWIGSHKHAKVLGRGLDMLALVGLGAEQSALMRLWYVEATGWDQGIQRGTIHTLTEAVRTVMSATDGRGLETLGTARGSRADIISSIQRNRDEVSRVGRRLAEVLGFEYPEALERTVREMWRQYRAGAPTERGWAGKKLGAAVVIQDGQGRVLLVRHSYGMLNWELPGGAAELNESVAETAVREVLEETGLTVKPERLTGTYYVAESDSHHFVFRCSMTHDGQEPITASEETTAWGYFPPDGLPRPISDFTERRIQDALAGHVSPLTIPVGPLHWLESP